jgi:uncharacterized protein YdhG (YjbR/CyaY superfamily)
MSVIDDYLKKVDQPERGELERIRKLIRSVAPDATEVMTYGMPGFKYQGKYLIAYAAFRDHLSVFPGAGATQALKSQLAGYKLSKGTIQFTLDTPLSDDIIKQLVKHRTKAIKG